MPPGVPSACPRAPRCTRFLCLSASVFRLYHGSSWNGVLCHTYFRTVLTSALLMRMHRYTMRNVFIDLKRKTTVEAERFPRNPALGVGRQSEHDASRPEQHSKGFHREPPPPAPRPPVKAETVSSSASEATLGTGLSLGPQGQSWGQGTLADRSAGHGRPAQGASAWSRALNSHNPRESTSSTTKQQPVCSQPGGRQEGASQRLE